MDLKATAVGGVFLVPHHSWDRAPVQGEAAQYKLLPDKCNYQKRGGEKSTKSRILNPVFVLWFITLNFPELIRYWLFNKPVQTPEPCSDLPQAPCSCAAECRRYAGKEPPPEPSASAATLKNWRLQLWFLFLPAQVNCSDWGETRPFRKRSHVVNRAKNVLAPKNSFLETRESV